MMDTGFEQAAIMDSAWANKQAFIKDMKVVRSTVMQDPRGNKFDIKFISIPLYKVNGASLTDVTVSILGRANPAGAEVSYLGNDLLKRFNMILDLQNDRLYLKPNKLFNVKYRNNG